MVQDRAGRDIRLEKETSNLFRERTRQHSGIDVTAFQHVLSVDPESRVIDTEGMVTYENVMLWANENFDRQKPDTVAHRVE